MSKVILIDSYNQLTPINSNWVGEIYPNITDIHTHWAILTVMKHSVIIVGRRGSGTNNNRVFKKWNNALD